jgi:class 3 adenylate cyclase/tetratricopeptide (TPR) repeat protein
MDLGGWLRSLGLAQYEAAFRENAINEAILPKLTAEDLKDIGVTAVGHRRVLLDAIATLRGETPSKQESAPSAATEPANRPNRVDGGLPEAERRQLTVMFCDLVGSTALSTKLDPEDLREIISTYHRHCAEVIVKYSGFVARYMGDGVLAYFGYPRAHEHDAERAVRAGLALIGVITKLDVGPGTALQVRVGIATGEVVVGDLMPDDPAHESEVVGETPNLAARLQALADPGTVVIDSNTRSLLGYLFEYRAFGPSSVKGFDDPVAISQVTSVSAVDSRFEALRTATTPLVGRKEDMELLQRRWEQAKGRDGCVVLISGEPGIGKSRIVQSILERIKDERHIRLRYFCSPHHQDTALYPAIRQIERTAKFRREDTAEQRLGKLEAVLALATDDLSEVVPLAANVLSIPVGGRYSPLNFNPQQTKRKLFKALQAQVEGLAGKQPLLMVWEDVQWSDPTSRELLDLTIDWTPSLPILLVITYRPEFVAPWVGRSHVTLLALNRLPPRRCVEVVAAVTGGKALPKEIVDQIVDRTDGVPLFIEEMTKAVVESGAVADAGDVYTLGGPLPPLRIPTSLNASLLARLDRQASVREVAQIGAALGRQFSHEVISAVARMPRQKLDNALAQLASAELILRSGSPPDAEYTFKHALVQDAAYGTLLRGRRQQLHHQIAATLEGQFPEIVEAQPELLARHFAEAGLVEKAAGYWLRAGDLAIERWAMAEAVSQLRKGLNVLSRMADDDASREQELNLQIKLGHALFATKGYAALESGEAFAHALQVSKQLYRQPKLEVLIGQFTFHVARGDLEKAEHQAERLRHLSETRDDRRWKAAGLAISGFISFLRGKFVEARTYYGAALSLWEPVYSPSVPSPDDPHVASLIVLSRTLLCLGCVDQARLRRDEALAEAQRISPYNRAYALCDAWSGDWAIEGKTAVHTMLQSAEAALAVSREQNFPMFLGLGNIMRGWCLAAMGQTLEGIPLITQGITLRRRDAGCVLTLPFFLVTLAEVYGMASQPEEGLNRLAEAGQLIETTQERWAEAEMHRLRGTLLLSMHEHAAAEDSYRHALAVAQRQSAKFWELRAALDLARLWRDQGKRTEARELLAPIYGWFTEGFKTPVLKDAKVLLHELAS